MRFHCPAMRIPVQSPACTSTGTQSSTSSSCPSSTGSAFTPISNNRQADEDPHNQKRTPPSLGKDSLSGIPRSLFPEPHTTSPNQLQQILMAHNPLLLRYYMQYPLAHPASSTPLHPQFIHAYKSLYAGVAGSGGVTGQSNGSVAHASMAAAAAAAAAMHAAVNTPRLSPSEASSPPSNSAPAPSSAPPQPPMMQSSYFPMPSDKDGEPLDLLPKSLYMNKSRKGHLCIYCGKLYSRKYGLKIHLRTHTGYKPLKCKVCLRPFGDPSNLNKHIRLHAEGETPYRCDYCGKVLVRRRDLERHVKSRHPGEMGDFEAKRLSEDLQNKSVDIDGNDNEVEESDDTDRELIMGEEETSVLCEEQEEEDEIEVD